MTDSVDVQLRAAEADEAQAALRQRLQTLRANLDAIYNELLAADTADEKAHSDPEKGKGRNGQRGLRLARLRVQAHQVEQEITHLRLRLDASGLGYLDVARPLSLEAIQATLPSQARLLVYYIADDELLAFIAVAALDEQQLKTSFSNYGSWVDLAAPGESIYSALPIDGYGWWSGTSMATPFVSGQIALLHSLAPWLTLSQIEGQMMTKVRNLDELNPDYAGQLGAGEPDVAASLGCHWADVEPDATHDILNNQCDDDVDIADVQSVAAQWGLPQPPGSAYDTDHDGDVDVADIQRVANRWGWKR